MNRRYPRTRGAASPSAFTLIEVLIVIILLGILSAILIPTFQNSRRDAEDAAYMGSIKTVAAQFSLYKLRNGEFPPDRMPAVMPAGMETYLQGVDWVNGTPLGGQWDWDYMSFPSIFTAGVSVYRPDRESSELLVIDKKMDDGNLSTGGLRSRGSGYTFVIVP